MRRALAAVSIACLALGASARAGVYVPPPADRYPAWTPDGGSLLYVSGRDDDRAHVIGADGSGGRAVGPAGRYTRVALAPDGRRLAVTGPDGPAYSSYVVDGEARLDLGPSVYLVPPSWAPDGRRLAVTRPDRTTVVDAATGAATLELPGLGYAA